MASQNSLKNFDYLHIIVILPKVLLEGETTKIVFAISKSFEKY